MLVGDDQHCDAHFAHPLQQLHHLKAHLGVDVAGRLVRDDQTRAVGQSAGHGHPLLLAAGEELGVDLCLILQMHQLQHIVDPFLNVLLADVGNVHRKGDVLVDRHGRDKAEVLKDDAHLAAEIGHFAPAQPGDILAVHEHAALCGQLLPEDELEQGGLACTGVSHQKDELAVRHMEVDVLQRGLVAPLVYLGDVFKIYHE